MTDSFVFFLETGKRYRPNSFCIVIYAKFVKGQTFFRIRSWPMTSSPYPVHVNLKFSILRNIVMWYLKRLQNPSWVHIWSYFQVTVHFCCRFRLISILAKYIVNTLWRHYDVTGYARILKKVWPFTNFA